MLVWLQHANYASDEYRDTTLETALEKFSTFDWQRELVKYEQAKENREDCCDPGIGLIRGDTHILHICPHSPEIASVFYHYKEPARILGIMPYLSSEDLHARNFPLKNIKELFAAHFANDHQATLTLLDEYR